MKGKVKEDENSEANGEKRQKFEVKGVDLVVLVVVDDTRRDRERVSIRVLRVTEMAWRKRKEEEKHYSRESTVVARSMGSHHHWVGCHRGDGQLSPLPGK